MTSVHSFPPIVGDGARILVLGSMPGLRSLAADEYYAHPRNAFWPIMGSLFDFDPARPYTERINVLQVHGVAVWDVLKLCTRNGSLDSSIVESSIVTNDFATFLRDNPSIDRIYFNGAKAESTFLRHVAPLTKNISMSRLPSTSPAHASSTFENKLDAWRSIIDVPA